MQAITAKATRTILEVVETCGKPEQFLGMLLLWRSGTGSDLNGEISSSFILIG